MAKTKCVVCGKFLGFDIGLGHYPNGAPHEKTKDGNWTCGPQCARDYNLAQLNSGGNSSSNSGANQSNTPDSEKKSGGFLGGLMGGGDSLASAAITSGLLAMAAAEGKENRNKVEYISKIVFSSNPEELSNQMNEILSTGAGTKDKELQKACYEKMDFGVLKLRQSGANAEADFFEKKRKSIKPSIFGGIF